MIMPLKPSHGYIDPKVLAKAVSTANVPDNSPHGLMIRSFGSGIMRSARYSCAEYAAKHTPEPP